MVHGNTPDEVKQDEEGLQIMRYLGRNMAWLLRLKESGINHGIEFPKQEESFIVITGSTMMGKKRECYMNLVMDERKPVLAAINIGLSPMEI